MYELIKSAVSLRYLSLCLLALFSAGACSAPVLVAFNGAGLDAPENTILAARTALKNGAGALWVTLQESSDGVIMLYRPDDLGVLTSLGGRVSDHSAQVLGAADAAWYFDQAGGYPLRGKGIGIPTLEEMLLAFPSVTFYLEVRASESGARRLGKTLQQVLARTGSLKRTRVYAGDGRFLETLPIGVRRFESPRRTLSTLASVAMSGRCLLSRKSPWARWHMSPLRQRVDLSVGTGGAPVSSWLMWHPRALACLRSSGQTMLVLSGIRNQQDLTRATALKADAVVVSSLTWQASGRLVPPEPEVHLNSK